MATTPATSTPSLIDTATTARTRARRRPMVALSLAAVGALALAACGGGGDDDSGIASIDEPTDTEDEVVDPDRAMADYRQCLADNGFDIDIQVGGGGGSISLGGGGDEADPQSGGFDPDAFSEAADACSDLADAAMGAFTPDPQQQAAMQDAQLRFEECMADNGLAGYTGGATMASGLGIGGSGGAADPQSGGSLDEVDPDVLREALDECSAVYDELEES